MDKMPLILTISQIGFRVCLVLMLLGLALAAYTYWKFNIKEIYLIKSGKAKRKSIDILEAHNRETGKLRDSIDLDFTTGNLKRPSRRFGRNSGKIAEEPQFKPNVHSGETGIFKTEGVAPSLEQSGQIKTKEAKPAAPAQEISQKEAEKVKTEKTGVSEIRGKNPEPIQQQTSPPQTEQQQSQTQTQPSQQSQQEPVYATRETVQLDRAALGDYSMQVSQAYQPGMTGELQPPAPEPRAPLTIISQELIIHTDEVIRI